MGKKLNFTMDQLLATTTIDAAMFELSEIANKYGAKWNFNTGEGTEIRYIKKDSPIVVANLQAIIKAKHSIGKSVNKEKKMLESAMALLREYIVECPIDEQIKILKSVQP